MLAATHQLVTRTHVLIAALFIYFDYMFFVMLQLILMSCVLITVLFACLPVH
jgi:hypothetical protein